MCIGIYLTLGLLSFCFMLIFFIKVEMFSSIISQILSLDPYLSYFLPVSAEIYDGIPQVSAALFIFLRLFFFCVIQTS